MNIGGRVLGGGMQIDTSQLDAIASDLGKAGQRVGAKASAAFRKTVFDIERDAKTLAPFEFGTLRNSIGNTIIGDGRHSVMAAEIGPTVDYGIWQEIGTSKMPPHPYLSPAFDRRIGPFTEAIAQIGGEVFL